MQQIHAKAYAKINLTLDVLGKRPDGYHQMDMVMQSGSLCDEVTPVKTDSPGISLSCDNPDVPFPCDESNLAYKAAKLLFEHQGEPCAGVSIKLKKNIPDKAGMAGGSADAAAVLVAANELFSWHLGMEELCKIGKTLGADVPFCIQGGTMRVQGFGEILTCLPDFPKLPIAVAKPKTGMSTAQAFEKIDTKQLVHPPVEQVVTLLSKGNVNEAAMLCGNVFMQVTENADVFSFCRYFNTHNALFSMMTGSGTAVFAVFEEEHSAAMCVKGLMEAGERAYLCYPEPAGVKLILEEEEDT